MSKKAKVLEMGVEQHECTATREGDWIIYTCKQCSYQRRINLKTNKMEVTEGNPLALHLGFYVDPVFQVDQPSQN